MPIAVSDHDDGPGPVQQASRIGSNVGPAVKIVHSARTSPGEPIVEIVRVGKGLGGDDPDAFKAGLQAQSADNIGSIGRAHRPSW